MSTYTQFLYQIVFSTKYRRPTMIKPGRKRLFSYIHQLLTNKRCHLYRINGVDDHLHIVTHVHQSIDIASLVKDIKLASGEFIREHEVFPEFTNWQTGYGAFTYHIKSKNSLIEYVKNQEIHHARNKLNYRNELIGLLNEHEIPWDEKYLE